MQELLIAFDPQGMYLGNRYGHRDCIFMMYIILISVNYVHIFKALLNFLFIYYYYNNNYYYYYIIIIIIIIIVIIINVIIIIIIIIVIIVIIISTKHFDINMCKRHQGSTRQIESAGCRQLNE